MQAYVLEGSFGIDHLTRRERPLPDPGPGQVRVRIRAASLNARDAMMVMGVYNPRQRLPLVPCSDGAGEVSAVGPGVTRFKVGDRVTTAFFQGWVAGAINRARGATALGGPLDGTLAEEMLASEEGLVATPAHLSDEEAATLPCAGVTAWSALVRHGHITAGDTVVVQGTGGVSVFALQLARLHGARVLVTSKSDEKLEKAKALGAEVLVHYGRTPEWSAAARAFGGGQGVDHIVEVGGAGTLEQSLRAVRMGGAIYVIGVLSGVAASVSLVPILMQDVRLQGVLVGPREAFEAMNRAISAAALRPVLDRVFPFDEAKAAFAHLASGSHFGKVVVRMG